MNKFLKILLYAYYGKLNWKFKTCVKIVIFLEKNTMIKFVLLHTNDIVIVEVYVVYFEMKSLGWNTFGIMLYATMCHVRHRIYNWSN